MQTYLAWVGGHTKTRWWHDSAEETELRTGLERGAIGVTTNPILASAALQKDRGLWGTAINSVLAANLAAEPKAEALMQIAVSRAAEKLLPEFDASRGQSGFVCAQVNPARAGDRAAMSAMARRFHAWAPNIAVKLPANPAGLDVLEDGVTRSRRACVAISLIARCSVAYQSLVALPWLFGTATEILDFAVLAAASEHVTSMV